MSPKPIRLWPGVAAVALQWLAWFVVPVALPDTGIFGMIAGALLGVVVLLWWLFFSRAPWLDRLVVFVMMVAALVAAKRVVHVSVANGMMGNMIYAFSLPFMSLALVASATIGRGRSRAARLGLAATAILLVCAGFTLIRTGGITGDVDADLHWRWTPTPEALLLAKAPDVPVAPPPPPAIPDAAVAAAAAPAALEPAKRKPAEWPGFRGPDRDGVVHGVTIAADWSKSPPVNLWRQPIGPGWSSFAVDGNFFYTQEQRGDSEDVSCYRLSDGRLVWRHRDATRFWESNGGAGPRGTPTLSGGRVYALGATGIVNALDARTGAVVWSRNAATDTGATMPGWGFSGSPLVVGSAVIVAASGRLAAYDSANGTMRWSRQTLGGGYSSPQLATLDGVAQVLMPSGGGLTSVALADGAVLWQHKWPEGSTSILQPIVTADGDVLIGAIDSAAVPLGTRRLTAKRGTGGWSVQERWTSTGLKPYFNDSVVHKGSAFGFDGSILACIDLETGARRWKGGRYGAGQLVLLPDQDALLVLSEEGELALVQATPDKFTELARVPGIEGKTWNHPVVVGDLLLVRNAEEMAAFRLSSAAAETPRAQLDEVQLLSSQLKYPAAMAAFEAVKAKHPEAITSLDGLKMVVVYAETGTLDKFLELTKWMTERWKTPKTVTDAERQIKGYVVSRAARDPALLAHAVDVTRYASEQAVAQDAGDYQGFFDTTRGVALYRAGKPAEAAVWLSKALTHENLWVRSLAQPVYAMALLAQGQRARANEALAEARRTAAAMPAVGTPEYRAQWTDTLITWMVMQEAEAAFAPAR